ncbi:MAG: DUF5615 family PIN-like protein [Proteiniphilum sp.]|jgi:predicted nuclease of predicted toxin-antitoxin system|uniref:DUF5615 family PIN-like protein n=1 Tax=Proteiniphilum sp. TaxID=1926877 RepID=UPI0026CDE355|nr:DUF5615 family PIN-like protein [Proteiniphilum sp.]MEA5126949.1 DUF5615 family PIN-like protein [Proteiniphilum sp.]
MQIRLLLDANLSWRSVNLLRQYYDDCSHVDSIGLSIPARDMEIWEYARQNEMIIVTNDEDFLHLAGAKGFPPKVILLRVGNQSRKHIEHLLINMKPQIILFIDSPEYGVLELV